jgi:hypothetical protein
VLAFIWGFALRAALKLFARAFLGLPAAVRTPNKFEGSAGDTVGGRTGKYASQRLDAEIENRD